jgi:WD40 repeat protein
MIPDSRRVSRSETTGGNPPSREAIRAALERELASSQQTYTPPPIPDHELVHRIGAGAYGDVWLARNALGTLRAVKIVYRARFEEDRPYEREFAGILKYEPLSRTHPGLVQVLHVGRNDDAGCFYYVMEAADAAPGSTDKDLLQAYRPRTLRSELAQRQRLSASDAAQLTLRLATALSHLHAQGLVHRDVKPGNVIFVGRQPKLADIGLIAAAGDSKSFVGTEGFIPPEGPGSPQADVYGLGKLLYELATGRDRLDFPQLTPDIANLPERETLLDLNEVITRACAPEPAHRYASAKEMETDLKLFLAGRSLREARKIERHLFWLKRFAVAACGFVVVAALAVWFAKSEERRAKEREHQSSERARVEAVFRARAEAAEHDARQQLYTALLEQARANVRSGELGHRIRALNALRRAAAVSNTVDLRREAFAALALADLRFEREFPAPPGTTLVQFDPRFERVAFCRGSGPVEVRVVSDQRLLHTLPASTNLMAYGGLWSSDGRYLLITRDYPPIGESKDLEVWDMENAQRILLLRDVRYGASFHPQLPRIMVGSPGATVAIWSLENAIQLAELKLPAQPRHLMYSPDGKRFAALYDRQRRGFLAVHNAADGITEASQTFACGLSGLDWHPHGHSLAVGGDDGSVNLIDSRTGESRTLGHHKGNAVLMAFTPDGRYLASGGWDRELNFWNVHAMRRAFAAPVDSFQMQFRTDANQCAVVTRNGVVQLHTFERPVNHREFAEDLGGRLHHGAFSPDGRWLAASGYTGLGVWDLTQPGPGIVAREAPEGRAYFTQNSSELFASSLDNACSRWRLVPAISVGAAPELQRLHLQKPESFTSLCLISNLLIWTGNKGSQTVPLDDIATAQEHWTQTSPGINRASPDGRWLVVHRPFSPSLYVYRVPDLHRTAKLTSLNNIGSVKFSPLRDELAVTSRTNVEFWNTTSWQRTRVITNFTGLVYTSDPHTWWLISYARTAGLYDARTLEPLLLLPTGMLPVALSPDGHDLAVSIDARRLQVWNLPQLQAELQDLGLAWPTDRSTGEQLAGF